MRTVLLTGIGAAGQVGETVAGAFGVLGDRVLLVGRTRSQVEERAAELSAAGHSVAPFDCDLADVAAVERLAASVRDREGPTLDAVIMMAGGFGLSGPVDGSDPAVFEQQVTINLRTAYLTTRSFVSMVRPSRGALVYFASEAVVDGGKLAGISAYGIAKSGVLALMRAVSQEERAHGVRANAIAPGSVRTARNTTEMGDAPFVERESVADLVTFLCSDAGAGITGQAIHLAGRRASRIGSGA